MTQTLAIPAWYREPHMPVVYGRLYVEIARERGLDVAPLLREAKIPAALLADPLGRISAVQFLQLTEAILESAGNDGLGLEAGMRQPLTVHGSLGLALMCCATVGEGLPVLQRFWYLRGRGVGLTAEMQGDMAALVLHTEMPMTPPVQQVLIESILVSLYRGLTHMAGEVSGAELWLQHPRPAYADRYLGDFNNGKLPPITGARPISALRIPLTLLQRPLQSASPETLHLAIAQCERELATMGNEVDAVLQKARALMVLGKQGYPSPAMLADALHVTERTLRRRLQQLSFNYKQLLEDARRRDALTLLDNETLAVQVIAELLGYRDPANFTRAFRGWTGKTPTEYRLLKIDTEAAR